MKLSVLVTTYNALAWLEKVIWGYAAQTHRDFELIIADDGSSPETADRIRALRRETGLDLVHLWQPDEGFQKCRVLNKAIVTARHDYLVFSDGDCIPRADFLAVHAARAQPGYYLSGSYYKLPSLPGHDWRAFSTPPPPRAATSRAPMPRRGARTCCASTASTSACNGAALIVNSAYGCSTPA